MITIFTPTYNRAYCLANLYISLCKQTDIDFEWIIVDDGSSDNTKELIQSFIIENKINIYYFQQNNGGKHRAINYGVSKAQGELFFIVDSDDKLAINAIERINFHWNNVKNKVDIVGVSGNRVFSNNDLIGSPIKYEVLDTNSLSYRINFKIEGDKAEAYKTSILLKYPFPNIKDEKFCAESLIWNRIAQNYKLRYFNEPIYICEYLNDGLSKASIENRKNSPTYACLLYKELYSYNIPLKYKIKAGINFWRFAFYQNKPFLHLIKDIGWASLLILPFSILLYFKDNI